ncbi:hypothetical protein GCM10009122_18030 [Fulvivirga kasyanovii]|uniref:Uncharacterized protein n=1 Tax=Fulvivirga kasyanovii TaxID=396812 RepID=A0ABW9RXL5_9BACT|nr:hypothetical protein [Fulvivirga kasyanovii]MTI28771.1 hypothetical protein [Fulvivirga kasyanovii]
MISKELFAIKFETDDKSGSGFLLREINSILLICKGPVLQEEFKIIQSEFLKQIERNKVKTCIADFGLMNIGMKAPYVKKDFHENISAAGITRLALVLPINATNGQCVQNALDTQILQPASLVAFYSYSLSDALLWMAGKSKKPVSYQSIKNIMASAKERLMFTINSTIG